MAWQIDHSYGAAAAARAAAMADAGEARLRTDRDHVDNTTLALVLRLTRILVRRLTGRLLLVRRLARLALSGTGAGLALTRCSHPPSRHPLARYRRRKKQASKRIFRPVHSRRGWIFDLNPITGRAGAITAIPAFRDQPLQSHLTGSLEQIRPDLALLEWG
jgi:hypothetical protein